jgi:hypothetical protein
VKTWKTKQNGYSFLVTVPVLPRDSFPHGVSNSLRTGQSCSSSSTFPPDSSIEPQNATQNTEDPNDIKNANDAHDPTEANRPIEERFNENDKFSKTKARSTKGNLLIN